jgi:hypothetical protein
MRVGGIMGITGEILKKIKEEIATDPDKLGYAGKSDKEIATLLSSSVFKEMVVIEAHSSPLNRILRGINESPNIVTEAEVTSAKIKE